MIELVFTSRQNDMLINADKNYFNCQYPNDTFYMMSSKSGNIKRKSTHFSAQIWIFGFQKKQKLISLISDNSQLGGSGSFHIRVYLRLSDRTRHSYTVTRLSRSAN
jgi:hypothetical protein